MLWNILDCGRYDVMRLIAGAVRLHIPAVFLDGIYLDPISMYSNGLLGYCSRLRAIILHTFGVQV